MTATATEVVPIQAIDDSGTAIARAASGDRQAFEHVYRTHLESRLLALRADDG